MTSNALVLTAFYALLLCLDAVIATWLFKKMFGTWEAFWRALKDSWLLQFTFFWQSQWYNREVSSLFVEVFIFVCVGLPVLEAMLLFH